MYELSPLDEARAEVSLMLYAVMVRAGHRDVSIDSDYANGSITISFVESDYEPETAA